MVGEINPLPFSYIAINYNLWLYFLENLFAKRFSNSPKNFQKMGEAENKTHLSRLARVRGAIGYIGFFVALTQTRGPVRTPPCAPYPYKAIYKRLQNTGHDREEAVRRTKVCVSA